MLNRLRNPKPFSLDLSLLVLRIAAGGLMLLHGIPKLLHFAERAPKFSDPLGISSPASLALTVFAEFFCSVLVILGLWTRIALIPLLITMGVVFFIVHGNDSLGERELPLFYLLAYTAIFLAGPGKYSADGLR